jgi:hypothetical protein
MTILYVANDRRASELATIALRDMPFGGQLKIEFATVEVDRKFVTQHPNVRPGAHVLITFTEVVDPVQPDWLRAVRNQPVGASSASASERPGVDLGALMGLIGDCGGHLWMTAEPPGNMVLKVHLPKRISDGHHTANTQFDPARVDLSPGGSVIRRPSPVRLLDDSRSEGRPDARSF